MFVVHLLKRFVKAGLDELAVQRRESGKDAGEELFECEGRRRLESIERGGGSGVGSIKANAYDGEELRGVVVRIYQDPANLDKVTGRGINGI